MTGIGTALVASKHPDEAIEPLTRALEIRTKVGIAPDLAAETRLVLGRALWSKDKPRARVLLDEARAAFEAHGERSGDVAEVDAFLASRK